MAVEKVIAASIHAYVKQTVTNNLLIGVARTGLTEENVQEESGLIALVGEGWAVFNLAKANAEKINQAALNTWSAEGTSAIFAMVEKAKAATIYSFYLQLETNLGHVYRLFPNSDRFSPNTLTKLGSATHDWEELDKRGAGEWESGEAPKKPSTATGLTGSEKGKSAGFDVDALILVEEGVAVGLNPAASASSAANAVQARTAIAPGSATGASSAVAAVTAQTLIDMAAATGTSVAALAANAISALVLNPASDTSSASINVHAVLEALLVAAASTSSAIGTVNTSAAPNLSLQAASSSSSATAVIHAVTQAILAAAASTSSASLSATASASVGPNPASSSSTAQAAVTAPSRVALAPAASTSNASLSAHVVTFANLSPASGVGAALALVSVPTTISLASASSTSAATLTVAAPPTLIFAPAQSFSAASATVGIYELAPPPYEPPTITPLAGHIAVGQAGRLSRDTGRIVITEAGRAHR